MIKSRHNGEQIVASRASQTVPALAEPSMKYDLCDPKIYAWSKHFRQMQVTDIGLYIAPNFEANTLNIGVEE